MEFYITITQDDGTVRLCVKGVQQLTSLLTLLKNSAGDETRARIETIFSPDTAEDIKDGIPF